MAEVRCYHCNITVGEHDTYFHVERIFKDSCGQTYTSGRVFCSCRCIVNRMLRDEGFRVEVVHD